MADNGDDKDPKALLKAEALLEKLEKKLCSCFNTDNTVCGISIIFIVDAAITTACSPVEMSVDMVTTVERTD